MQKSLQEEIVNTNKLFLDVKKQTATLLDRIKLINNQIGSRKEMIGLYQREIDMLRTEQSIHEKEIEELDKKMKITKVSYSNAINGIIKSNRFSENKLMFILSGRSFSESLRRMQYLRNYSQWRKEQVDEIKKQNESLIAKKVELQRAKENKQNVLASLQSEQSKLQSEEKVRQSEITEAKNKQKELHRTIQDKQKQVNKLNAQIEKLIAEEVARQERDAEAKRIAEETERKRNTEKVIEKTKREYESGNKSKDLTNIEPNISEKIITEPKKNISSPKVGLAPKSTSTEDLNLSTDFASNKGHLPMPVTGASVIVTNFGVNKSNEWNITTTSNGIDIQTQQDANVRSVFQGVISKIFPFPGSNTCIIVRHGEYYTFYGNIFDIYVKQGEKVKTGQALGKIFTDPDSGIAKMHFQLWKKTTKLDPKPWLNK
ncbi:MAG: peptidoglycan DD-metalloendopeptidase family protein [Dysgonamonadaceae bacterium]